MAPRAPPVDPTQVGLRPMVLEHHHLGRVCLLVNGQEKTRQAPDNVGPNEFFQAVVCLFALETDGMGLISDSEQRVSSVLSGFRSFRKYRKSDAASPTRFHLSFSLSSQTGP